MVEELSSQQKAMNLTVNSGVLHYLEKYAVPESKAPAISWIADGYDLHTHPDLGELLEQIGRPTGCLAFYFLGYNVLATAAGVIFALAKGTSTLAFRLPNPADKQDALLAGATPYMEVRPEWVEFPAWNTGAAVLQAFCIHACKNALNL